MLAACLEDFTLNSVFRSHVTLFSIPKKLLHIARNKIKKNHDNWLKKQKSYSKSKNVQKMPKKLKIISLKIHKGAGILKNPQNLFK